MSRRFANFSRPARQPYTWIDYFLIGVVVVVCSAAFLGMGYVFLLTHPSGMMF